MPRNWRLQAEQSSVDRKWYVRLRGGNGEIVLRSKGFASAAEAMALCEQVRNAEIAVLPHPVDEAIATWVLKPHKGVDGQWYNRLTVRTNGKAERMWSEGYPRIDSAKRACERTRAANVVILEPLAAAAPKKATTA